MKGLNSELVVSQLVQHVPRLCVMDMGSVASRQDEKKSQINVGVVLIVSLL